MLFFSGSQYPLQVAETITPTGWLSRGHFPILRFNWISTRFMAGSNFGGVDNPAKFLIEDHLLYEANPVTCLAFSIQLPAPRRSHSIPIICLLLIVASGLATADVAKAKPSPCALTDAELAGLSGDASTDSHAMFNYAKTMYALLKAGEFEQLDCLADLARSHKETFPGGMWKIHSLYSGLAQPPLHPTEEDWAAHIESLQRWASTKPDSVAARVALAESYVNYGWDARGSGYADTVSESGWKLFANRAAKAKQILEEGSALSAKDPEWYFAMQSVALAQSWEPDVRQALLEKAVKFEPAYYYYYRAYTYSILPKWGGEDGEVAKFLQETADKIGGDAGDILYFRVAGTLVCGCQNDQKLGLSWPRIQMGFEAVEKRNGSSLENLNLLAHMAFSLGQIGVAYETFSRIGDQWSPSVWDKSSDFESAKKWAKQDEPFLAARQAAEESAEANLHTPAGQHYKPTFDENIHTWMQPCVEALAGSGLGHFELLIKLGKEGEIEDINGTGVSPLMQCLGGKLHDFQRSKQAVFPPPPRPDYWSRLDFSSENSTSAALK